MGYIALIIIKNNPNQTLSYSIKKDFITKDTIRGFTGFSSGRLNDWSEIINEFSNSNNFEKLFGFGSQGDRFTINQSASNGMLYALISSGLIGFSFFILFSVLVFIKCIQALLSRKKKLFYFTFQYY